MSVPSISDMQRAIVDWVEAASGLPRDKIAWADEAGDRPVPPFIELSLDDQLGIGHDWRSYEPRALAFTDVSTTADALTDRLSSASPHGLLTGDGSVEVSSAGTLPTGLAADTPYWVIVVSPTVIRLSETFDDAMTGVFIDLTDNGVGAVVVSSTAESERVGQEFDVRARGMRVSTLTLQAYGDCRQDVSGMSLLRPTIDALALHEADLDEAGVGIGNVGVIQNVTAGRGGILEPRARCEVVLHTVSEISGFAGRIARAQLTVNEADVGEVAELWIPDAPP